MATLTTTDAALADADRLVLAAGLQDLIAHRVTAMEVQAAAAGRLLLVAPAGAAEALAAVVRLGQEAMGDLGRLGRLLDDGAPPAMRPAPTLANLEGVPRVRLDIGGEAVPDGVALCAVGAVRLLLEGAPSGDVRMRVAEGALRIESAGVLPAGDRERLRTLARPCGGRLRRTPGGGCRLDLPLAP